MYVHYFASALEVCVCPIFHLSGSSEICPVDDCKSDYPRSTLANENSQESDVTSTLNARVSKSLSLLLYLDV